MDWTWEGDKERGIESVNRKGVFGLFFLLKERCCWRGQLVISGKNPTLCVGKVRFNLVGWKSKCILTAARFVVEPRGHEETLLGCGGRQGPLVGRKDGNHQWGELALDLLREAGGRGDGIWEGRGWREGRETVFKVFTFRHRLTTVSTNGCNILQLENKILSIVFLGDASQQLTLTQLRARP